MPCMLSPPLRPHVARPFSGCSGIRIFIGRWRFEATKSAWWTSSSIGRRDGRSAERRPSAIVVDTLREIASNKICTVLSRSEIKDLVDLQELVEEGIDLEQVLADAARKDGSVDPATLAWLLDEIRIGPHARLPGGVDPVRLVAFRDELVRKLRTMAFARATRDE